MCIDNGERVRELHGEMGIEADRVVEEGRYVVLGRMIGDDLSDFRRDGQGDDEEVVGFERVAAANE